MAVVGYNTIEKLTELDAPARNHTWIGYDGCGGHITIQGAQTRVCPTGSDVLYDNGNVQEIRPPIRSNGINRGTKFPQYRFTQYYRGRIETRNHLVKRNMASSSSGLRVWYQEGYVAKSGPTSTCTRLPTNSYYIEGAATYRTVAHSVAASTYVVSRIDKSVVDDVIAECEEDAAVKAFSSMDLLTEIAEAREIPEAVRAGSRTITGVYGALIKKHGMRLVRNHSRVTPRKLMRSGMKSLQALGSDWMAYRYSVMPLVYSYRDVLKTVKRGVETTTRSYRPINATPLNVSLPSTGIYLWEMEDGSIEIRATVRQFFTWSEVSMLSGVSVNPFLTAWELIPYSFVADWFVNVGDYIIRRTSQTCARHIYACHSQRTRINRKTYVHYRDESYYRTIINDTPVGWMGPVPPTPPSWFISKPEEDQLLTEVSSDIYSRFPYFPAAAQLELKPSLNWKRLIDSAVMSLNPLKKLSKLLKG